MNIHIQGNHPTLCIVAGTHGDEYGVIASVEKTIQTYAHLLPDFVWIPEISPSAVARKTRKNTDEVDVNRSFQDSSLLKEVVDVMEAVRKFHFTTVMNFHEDVELNTFYCYDTGSNPPSGWDPLCATLSKLGIPLLNGVDDPKDPVLGYTFKDGYCSYTPTRDGSLESWMHMHGLAERIFTPEIPGRLTPKLKDAVVDAIFSCLIL